MILKWFSFIRYACGLHSRDIMLSMLTPSWRPLYMGVQWVPSLLLFWSVASLKVSGFAKPKQPRDENNVLCKPTVRTLSDSAKKLGETRSRSRSLKKLGVPPLIDWCIYMTDNPRRPFWDFWHLSSAEMSLLPLQVMALGPSSWMVMGTWCIPLQFLT